jgi:hypothetical protein
MAGADRPPARPDRSSDTGRYRRLSRNQKDVNTAHAHQRGPGQRVNAELKNWKILRKIRSCPHRAGELVAAVQTLVIANTWTGWQRLSGVPAGPAPASGVLGHCRAPGR